MEKISSNFISISLRRLTVLIVLIVCSDFAFGQSWTRTILSDRVSVDFPTKPEIQESGNMKIYQIENSDYIVSVLVVDMSLVQGFDIEQEQLNDFYRGVIKGKLDAATKGKLIGERKITLSNLEGWEVEYSKDFNGIHNIKVTSWNILANKIFYTFEIWDLSRKGQRKVIKKFFKSVKLNS